jgi:hypothetical protein
MYIRLGSLLSQARRLTRQLRSQQLGLHNTSRNATNAPPKQWLSAFSFEIFTIRKQRRRPTSMLQAFSEACSESYMLRCELMQHKSRSEDWHMGGVESQCCRVCEFEALT